MLESYTTLPLPPYAKVKYVDRFNKPLLYEQYPEAAGQNLVSIDVVDDWESLLKYEDCSRDFIVAYHFLALLYPIATLKTFEKVLMVGMVILLDLPVKRYTFDINRK